MVGGQRAAVFGLTLLVAHHVLLLVLKWESRRCPCLTTSFVVVPSALSTMHESILYASGLCRTFHTTTMGSIRALEVNQIQAAKHMVGRLC